MVVKMSEDEFLVAYHRIQNQLAELEDEDFSIKRRIRDFTDEYDFAQAHIRRLLEQSQYDDDYQFYSHLLSDMVQTQDLVLEGFLEDQKALRHEEERLLEQLQTLKTEQTEI